MSTTKNNIFITLLIFISVVVLLIAILQLLAKQKVMDFITEKTPPHVRFQYQDLSVNVLNGKIQVEHLSLWFSENDTLKPHTTIDMMGLVIEGFSYWHYVVNNTVHFNAIVLKNPDFVTHLDQKRGRKDTVNTRSVHLSKSITIRTIEIHNGSLILMDKEGGYPLVKANKINFTLFDNKSDSLSINKKIPFTYHDYSLFASNIITDFGPYETVKVDSIFMENKVLRLQNLTLESKYGKRELSKVLRTEHDHTTLAIKDIVLQHIDFGFQDERFFISANIGKIESPHLEIYRDKLVADDLSTKRLYSRMLRELPFTLEVMELNINDGHLGYEELVNADTDAGRLTFDHIKVKLRNISNTYPLGGKTTINVEALFMENAPARLDWSFDVNSSSDAFLASGSFKDLDFSRINSFLESNLRSKAKGHASEIYFTVNGNATNSSGDIKMKYQDLEFLVLRKDRLAINKMLTAIGSLFMDNGSKTDKEGYRNGLATVERDPTKSFYNYLWANVREGVVHTITRRQKKE